jgi:hypothetical protein
LQQKASSECELRCATASLLPEIARCKPNSFHPLKIKGIAATSMVAAAVMQIYVRLIVQARKDCTMESIFFLPFEYCLSLAAVENKSTKSPFTVAAVMVCGPFRPCVA